MLARLVFGTLQVCNVRRVNKVFLFLRVASTGVDKFVPMML